MGFPNPSRARAEHCDILPLRFIAIADRTIPDKSARQGVVNIWDLRLDQLGAGRQQNSAGLDLLSPEAKSKTSITLGDGQNTAGAKKRTVARRLILHSRQKVRTSYAVRKSGASCARMECAERGSR